MLKCQAVVVWISGAPWWLVGIAAGCAQQLSAVWHLFVIPVWVWATLYRALEPHSTLTPH